MEEIKETLNTLLTQVIGLRDDIKKINGRINVLKTENEARNPVVMPHVSLARAPYEFELKETCSLPDCVKELQTFEGQPERYVSSAILNNCEVIKGRPLLRSIVCHIRQKIRGEAEEALDSYEVPDDDWQEIRRVLAHDVRTLEYQLSQLSQGNKTLEEYYLEVNKHLSLILNGLKSMGHTVEVVRALSERARDMALDVFIRGAGNDDSRLLIMRRPKDLQEAYFFCKELQAVAPMGGSQSPAPANFLPNTRFSRSVGAPRLNSSYQRNGRPSGLGYGGPPAIPQNNNHFQSPRRAIKMESNWSGQSYYSKYRAYQNEGSGVKRLLSENQNPFQRATKLYHMFDASSPIPVEHCQVASADPYYNHLCAESVGIPHQDVMEVMDAPEQGVDGPNFMIEAS